MKERTLTQLIFERARTHPDAPVFFEAGADGRWRTTTWAEMESQVRALAGKFYRMGLRRGDVLAICAPNAPIWELAHFSALSLGASVIGIDPRLPAEERSRALARVGAAAIVGDVDHPFPTLVGANFRFRLPLAGLIESCRHEPPAPAETEARPRDIATLVFTSGTTGEAKTIAYRHEQLVRAVESIREVWPQLGEEDRLLCWLPLANLFQRVVNLIAMRSGAPFHFVDAPDALPARLAELRPTVFVGVPRVFEKLRAVGGAGGLAALLGGRVRLAISGSAPLARAVLDDYRISGVPLCEAYGVSENVVPMAMNVPGATRAGSVGKPLPENELRIAADGEVLVRGPGVFAGYLDEPTSALDAAGFYHTGDLGHFDGDGYLFLHGRKCETVKTANGRKVALPQIEGHYRSLTWLRDFVVIGHGKPYLVALFCVDASRLPKVDARMMSRFVECELARLGESLAVHERVRRFAVLPDPLSVEHGELTANGKLRRAAIEKRHADLIADLYEAESPGVPGRLRGRLF